MVKQRYATVKVSLKAQTMLRKIARLRGQKMWAALEEAIDAAWTTRNDPDRLKRKGAK